MKSLPQRDSTEDEHAAMTASDMFKQLGGLAPRSDLIATWLGLKMVLALTSQIFVCRSVVPETTLEQVFKTCINVRHTLANEPQIRQCLGSLSDIWADYQQTFANGVDALKKHCLLPPDMVNGANPMWANYMVQRHVVLRSDLASAHELLAVARLLVTGSRTAQDAAGQEGFDRELLQLIELCIRVLLRGFDGESGGAIEEVYSSILDSIKKVLVLALEFLRNFVLMNDNRMLQLWLDLFCSKELGRLGRDLEPPPAIDSATFRNPDSSPSELDSAHETHQNSRLPDQEPSSNLLDASQSTSTSASSRRFLEHLQQRMTIPDVPDPHDASQCWQPAALYKLFDPERHAQLAAIEPVDISETPNLYVKARKALTLNVNVAFPELDKMVLPRHADKDVDAIERKVQPIRAAFTHIFPGVLTRGSPEAGVMVDPEEEGDDLEDFSGNQPKPRGIMADLPMVVGPTELDTIAIIIASGINIIFDPQRMDENRRMMQAMRCHILLNQHHGRQFLKELLVFLAAWEISEGQRYFVSMANIVLAILQHGLIPFAYHAVADGKDIISPAQNALLKLLHYTFGKKNATRSNNFMPNGTDPKLANKTAASMAPHLACDLSAIRHLLAIFRKDVLPPVLAVLWLQGRVHAGVCPPDEFPLNLWDMERLYEGVYAFLDLFVAFNDVPHWKHLPMRYKIAYDILQLLDALDAHIPRSLPLETHCTGDCVGTTGRDSLATGNGVDSSDMADRTAHLVERPYEEEAVQTPADDVFGTAASADDFESQSPQGACASAHAKTPHAFAWPNLKKACLMALSGLLHQTPTMQEQIRALGGVNIVMACCAYDAHNPFVKEHAMLCLRFLLEGEKDLGRVFEQLNGRQSSRTTDTDRLTGKNQSMSTGDGSVSPPHSRQSPTQAEKSNILGNNLEQNCSVNLDNQQPDSQTDSQASSQASEADKASKADETYSGASLTGAMRGLAATLASLGLRRSGDGLS